MRDAVDPYRFLSLAVINQAIEDGDTGWFNGKSKAKVLFFEVAELTIDEIFQKRCRKCLGVLDDGYVRRKHGYLCYVCDLNVRAKRQLTNRKSREV